MNDYTCMFRGMSTQVRAASKDDAKRYALQVFADRGATDVSQIYAFVNEAEPAYL